jgi:RNA polymerase sigma factor (sigma-70 family)
MKPFEVELKLRNNLLKQRRVELGMTPRQLAEAVGVHYEAYLSLEGLRRSPIGKRGEWLSVAIKIADFHQLSPEELWPPEVFDVVKTKASMLLDRDDVMALTMLPAWCVPAALPSPDARQAENDRRDLVQRMLETLTAREREVVTRAFGLDGEEPRTDQEIADSAGRSKSRIGQIKAKALRRLRRKYERTEKVVGGIVEERWVPVDAFPEGRDLLGD